MIIGDNNYYRVRGFRDIQMLEMRAFIQGAVYCWCKNRPDEWFAARDLFGGENYYWEGTPLMPLYDYYLGGDQSNLLKQERLSVTCIRLCLWKTNANSNIGMDSPKNIDGLVKNSCKQDDEK